MWTLPGRYLHLRPRPQGPSSAALSRNSDAGVQDLLRQTRPTMEAPRPGGLPGPPARHPDADRYVGLCWDLSASSLSLSSQLSWVKPPPHNPGGESFHGNGVISPPEAAEKSVLAADTWVSFETDHSVEVFDLPAGETRPSRG